MNYSETLEYLFSQLPMYHRIGAAAYKSDLNNTIAICSDLGNPQNNFKSIHIAGTNGKGSVSHFLASILQEMGYKTGLYTSPHLKDFRERIRINGEMIPENNVVEFVEEHQSQFDKIKPSFFEWTVGLAFDYFSNEKVDIAIIETGLGGRLDSTNIISPILSVITNISLDHIALLGNSFEKIAFEKAGIIKNNVPVVIGRKQTEIKPVFENKAKECNAEILYASDYFEVKDIMQNQAEKPLLEITIDSLVTSNVFNKTEKIISSLTGLYQKENISTVLTCMEMLNRSGFKVDIGKIKSGIAKVIENTGIRGRWEVLSRNPTVIVDTGHNEDGIAQIIKQLEEMTYSKLRFVFGTVNDKDIDKIIRLLPREAVYYFCKANIPRALDEKLLLKIAVNSGLTGTTYNNVASALQKAKLEANINDLILVGGSNFVVAEVI